MKSYKLFVSTYESVEIILASAIRDKALDVQNRSNFVEIQANTLNEAEEKFALTEEYTKFLYEKSKVYLYYLDEKGNIHSVNNIDE